jgi:hypothetical protein
MDHRCGVIDMEDAQGEKTGTGERRQPLTPAGTCSAAWR